MKNVLQTLFLLACCLTSGEARSQNMDDTTFVGAWKWISTADTGAVIFRRCEKLEPNQEGFQITMDAKTLRRTINQNDVWADLPGAWWSLRMGRFDMQYFDTTLHKMVILGFEYASPDDKNQIRLVRYEVFQRTEDSGFQGYWKAVSGGQSNEILYVRCDNLEANVSGMYITDKAVVRRAPVKPGKKKLVDSNGTWWSSTEGYFDIQYYHTQRDIIIIEGFEAVESGNTSKIKRTRYEELKN